MEKGVTAVPAGTAVMVSTAAKAETVETEALAETPDRLVRLVI